MSLAGLAAAGSPWIVPRAVSKSEINRRLPCLGVILLPKWSKTTCIISRLLAQVEPIADFDAALT